MGKPIEKSWDDAPEEVFRASHLAICEICGKEFGKHQWFCYGDKDKDFMVLYLVQTCDGKLWKL
jgi:hypothetical protein